MMALGKEIRPALLLLSLLFLLYIASRFWCGVLMDNHWSCLHWRFIPSWYLFLWFAALVAFTAAGVRYYQWPARLVSSGRNVAVALGGLFLLTVAFQFDSFVYSGGNLRVAQLAQAEAIVYRWYEYGSVLVGASLFRSLSLFGVEPNVAGTLAWKSLSFGCALLSLTASALLSRELVEDKTRRFYLFLLLLFGPHALMLFGFVGVEPVVVAASSWFALAAVRVIRRFSVTRLLLLWGIVVIGATMHYSVLYLVPAAAYLSVLVTWPRRTAGLAALVLAGLSYLALVVLCYWWAGANLEFSTFVLFLGGKNPHADYGLLSARHIGDVLQLLFLAAPQLPAVLLLMPAVFREPHRIKVFLTATVMSISGLTVVMILDPGHGIPSGFPRLASYLYPLAFMSAIIIGAIDLRSTGSRTTAVAVAAVSLFVLLAYKPVYTRISIADGYLADYLEQHHGYYREGCYAFRDAYFYRSELSKADAWEWKVPTYSMEYKNLLGCRDLALAGEDSDALRSLYRLKAENPYWTAPRDLIVSIQMKNRRYELAKPEIDTLLLLDPYRKEYLAHRYRYYREVRAYPEALRVVKRTLDIYPHDDTLRADCGFIYLFMGAIPQADSVAQTLLGSRPEFPYGHSLKGMILERLGQLDRARHHYEIFIDLASYDDPDLVTVRKRLRSVEEKIGQEPSGDQTR